MADSILERLRASAYAVEHRVRSIDLLAKEALDLPPSRSDEAGGKLEDIRVLCRELLSRNPDAQAAPKADEVAS